MSPVKTLVINVTEDATKPLFKTMTAQESFDARSSGEWATVLFKRFPYNVDGTSLRLYHDAPKSETSVSAYFRPSDDALKCMESCTSALAPGRVLSEILGYDYCSPDITVVGRNFDKETNTARTIGIFNKCDAVPEGKTVTEIDLSVFTDSDFNEYDSLGLFPAGMQLENFYHVEHDLVVQFVKKMVRRLKTN